MRKLILSFLITAGFALAPVSHVVHVIASEITYKFKCGDCGKIEEFSTSGTHYCYGSKDHPHTKRIMERLSSSHVETYRYKCGDCGKIEEYSNPGTYFCYGPADHHHSKRIMERLSR